jgi:iron complex outermembrane receptor protein
LNFLEHLNILGVPFDSMKTSRRKTVRGPVLKNREIALFASALLSVSAQGATDSPSVENGPRNILNLNGEAQNEIKSELATPRPTPVSATAASVTILTQDDIRRAGVTTLPDALRLVPGLDVVQFDSSSWSVSSRGFSDDTFDNIQLMFDGRRANDPFGGVFWDTQDAMLEEIDHIEILRGPSATMLSPDGLNGIVNVVTKNAKDSQGLLLTGGGGTHERAFGGLRYGGKISDTAYYKVYAKYAYRDSVVDASGKRIGDDWHTGREGFRVDWDPNDKNSFLFSGEGYGLSEGNQIDDQRFIPPVSKSTETHNYGGNLLGRWVSHLSDESDLKLQASYERGHQNNPYNQLYNYDTVNADLSHSLRLGDQNEFVWGGTYRLISDHVADQYDISFDPSSYNSQVYGLFAADEFTIVDDKLKLTAGAKLEHNDFSDWEIEPSGRLAWTLTDRQTAWAGIGRSVRIPTRWETSLDYHNIGGDLLGNPTFKSMEVISYELGYRIQPCTMASFDVTGFYNDYSNLRTFETLPAPAPLVPSQYGNNMFGETYGVELASNIRATEWWRFRAGYSYTKSFLHTESGSNDFGTEGVREGTTPQNQLFVHSSMDLPANLTFDAVARYVDRTIFAPSYLVGDFRLAWSPCRNAEIALVGRNISDKKHTEAGGDYLEQSVFATLTIAF